jgi:hypothetical protein
MNIVIADADDWKGLYIDGKLIYQDHEIRPATIFREVTKRYKDISFSDVEFGDLDKYGGSFPKNLDCLTLP